MFSPLDTERGWAHAARMDEAERQRWDGEGAEFVDVAQEAYLKLRRKLPGMARRAKVRDKMREYIERVIIPSQWDPKYRKLAEKLRRARQSFSVSVLRCGKWIVRWDDKAGLPLFDPDDAREEARRFQKRILPALVSHSQRKHRLYYAVFTIPNPPAGELKKGMGKLNRKFSRLMRLCKKKNRPLPIIGSASIMETPLAWRRDWHPHLNVILVCDGFLDYQRLRSWWHWDVEIRYLEEHQIEGTLREIIKYSVKTVEEKSDEKRLPIQKAKRLRAAGRRAGVDRRERDMGDGSAAAGSADESQGAARRGETRSPPPPPMTGWTAPEFVEYLEAHKAFRRTRTYGCLFRLPKPEKLCLEGARALIQGMLHPRTREYVVRCPLLEFIPGDKSILEIPRPVSKWLREHYRPPPAGAAEAPRTPRAPSAAGGTALEARY